MRAGGRPRRKPGPSKQTGRTIPYGPSGTGTGTFTGTEVIDVVVASRFGEALQLRLETAEIYRAESLAVQTGVRGSARGGVGERR